MATSTAQTTTASPSSDALTPIMIDLGKKKNKQIRDLKRGRGKLMDQVAEVLERVRADLGPGTDPKNLVPIVMIYRKKQRRRRGLLSL